MDGAQSLFVSPRPLSVQPEARRVLVTARPLSLQRAITNPVENALKSGRRATLEVSATATTAAVTAEDAGGPRDLSEMERLAAPFRCGGFRGPGGHGLRLATATTVAKQHGGGLSFWQGTHCLVARLAIDRV